MVDIVEWLRNAASEHNMYRCDEAADEIERLRAGFVVMDKDEKYILDELAYAVERNTWFELGGHLSTKLQAMLKSKDAEIERLREALKLVRDELDRRRKNAEEVRKEKE